MASEAGFRLLSRGAGVVEVKWHADLPRVEDCAALCTEYVH